MGSLFGRVLQAVTTLMVLVGWMVLTNHCALASFQGGPVAKEEHHCCQSGVKKSEDSPGRQPLECCKSLKAAAPDVASKLTPASQPVLAVLPLMLMVLFDISQKSSLAIFETGPPPDSFSFTELVLQQCLLAHAPPLA